MLDFKCINCDSEIQADHKYMGQALVCPVCSGVVIMPDPVLPSGTSFNGYTINDLIGASLLWNTYLASDKETQVLIRIPTAFFLKNVSAPGRFFDAVIKSGTLNLPEFPKLLDRSLLTGKVYFVFNYMKDYRTLSDFLTGSRIFEYYDSVSIIRKCAVALKKAWDSSLILHQNITPDNIRVNDEGEVRILNLGIYDFLIKDYTLLDNGFDVWDCRYMSPEFIRAGKADSPLCDIYSLGAILYMMITSSHPYDEIEPGMIPEAQIPNPLLLDPNVPGPLVDLIRKFMDKDIGRRTASWDDFISEIDIAMAKLAKRKTPSIVSCTGIAFGDLNLAPSGYGKEKIEQKKIFLKKKKNPGNEFKNTDTVARLKPVDLKIETIQRNWSSNSAVDAPPKHRKNYQLLIIFSVLFVIMSLLISIIIVFNKDKIKSRSDIIGQDKAADNSDPEKFKGKTEEKNSGSEQRGPEPGKKSATPHPSASDNALALYEKAKTYMSQNKTDHAGGIAMLESARILAMDEKQFVLEQEILERIQDIEEPAKKLIKAMKEKLKSNMDNLKSSGDLEGAQKYLLDYKGEYEKETEEYRLALADGIKKDIEEKNKQLELKRQNAIKAFKQIFIDDAHDIANCNLTSLRINMEKVLGAQEMQSLKNEIEAILADIKKFESGENAVTENYGPLVQGIIFIKSGFFSDARESLGKIPYDAGAPVIAVIPEDEAKAAFASLVEKCGLRYSPDNLDKVLTELESKNFPPNLASEIFLNIQEFRKKHSTTKFHENSSHILEAIEKSCKKMDKGSKLVSDIRIKSAANPLEACENLADLILKAPAKSIINIEKGIYGTEKTSKIISISQNNIIVDAAAGTEINAIFEISGDSVEISGIIFKNTVKIEKNSKNIKIRNCVFSGTGTIVSLSESVEFDNCFIRELIVVDSLGTALTHCTLTTAKFAKLGTPLVVSGSSTIDISDCVIYGDKYGILFSEEGNPKKRKITNTLLYGETGLVAKEKNKVIIDKDTVKKSTKLVHYCKTKQNLYEPASFINPANGNWELVPSSPGSKASKDGTDYGVVWDPLRKNAKPPSSESQDDKK